MYALPAIQTNKKEHQLDSFDHLPRTENTVCYLENCWWLRYQALLKHMETTTLFAWFKATQLKAGLTTLSFTFVKLTYIIIASTGVFDYIKYLHKRFVIVPVDKASNKFGIVCKKFYLKIMKENLRYQIYFRQRTIYATFIRQIFSTFGNKLLDENQKLPLLYWTSK